MSDAPLMLGVSGLRGVTGQSLTTDIACRYAAAFGAWLADRVRAGVAPPGPLRWDPEAGVEPEPMVVLARDGRAGGAEILEAAARGLGAAGCHVLDAGVAMTPTAGVLVDDLRADGALIVTASHNPQEWNGLKCLIWNPPELDGAAACAPPAALAAQIIERFGATGDVEPAEPDLRREVSGEAHLNNLLIAIDPFAGAGAIGAGVRIVLDSVNASGRELGAALLESLGATLFHTGADPTGVFPHPPEPTRENLGDLAALVRARGAEIGFAQDPDGDRLAIIDERGEYIGEEYTLALSAMAVLEQAGAGAHAAALVTNLSTSRMLDDIAARFGAEVVRTPVGEANVVEAMKRLSSEGRRVLLGGEGNGGVIWPKVTLVRDSLSAMALVLALRARRRARLSDLVRDIPAYAIEKRKAPLRHRDDAAPALERLAAHFAGARIDRQDGVRIDLDDRRAWVHIRPSNTEPILRLIAEAPDPASAAALLEEAGRAMA
ncbi:MAG: phosphoglucosamine mutase [Phycisphaerales bacterium JB039]